MTTPIKKTIILEKSASIGTITFNRPEAMNALNDVMAKDLLTAIQDMESDDSIKVVILKGAGPLFMAGGDVRYFNKNIETLNQNVGKMIDVVHAVSTILYRMPKLVIASVHGSVAGIGMSFMMASDLVCAAQETKFTLAYSNIGTSPDGGSTFALPRIVGTKRAMQLALTSDIIDTTQAEALGLINYIAPSEQLDDMTLDLAKRLAAGPSLAFARTKALINQSLQNNLEEQLMAEQKAFIASTETADFKTGVSSFVKKEKPIFQGK